MFEFFIFTNIQKCFTMSRIKFSIYMLSLFGIVISCCSKSVAPAAVSTGSKTGGGSSALAPCIIYKTKSDYSKNVPVILSDDKTTIVSYPDIRDIYFQGKFSYPQTLSEGFLLDNRGIGPGVAFLNYTYEEYAKLGQTPSVGELFKRILDNDPLLEMYQCGNRNQYKDIEKELNDIISSGKLGNFARLK